MKSDVKYIDNMQESVTDYILFSLEMPRLKNSGRATLAGVGSRLA
jgi:hypothetical protein